MFITICYAFKPNVMRLLIRSHGDISIYRSCCRLHKGHRGIAYQGAINEINILSPSLFEFDEGL